MVTAPAGAGRGRLRDAAALVALLVIAYLIFGRVFTLKPLGEDNFYIMSWVDRAPASALLRLDPQIYPEWRPLAYQTIWLQYRSAGIDRMADYYVVNLVLWALAAWLVYRIVYHLVRSVPAAFAAAVFVLSDVRAIPSVAWIVERQSSMACVFGLAAVLPVLRAGGRRLSRVEWVAIAALLLASALSKEFGLAFTGAVVVYALWERRADLAGTAILAAVIYGALRLTLAGGGASTYCEDVGYFFVTRMGFCYNGWDSANLPQIAYNIVATGIGSFLHGLFAENGRIGIARLPLLLSLLWGAVAVVGWRRGPRELRLMGLIIAANTALCFMAYQARNQLVAVCAVGVIIGAGLAAVLAIRQPGAAQRWGRAALAAAVAGLLVVQVVRARTAVNEAVEQLMRQDPCRMVPEHPEAAAFAHRIKTQYGTGGECTVR